MNLDSVIQYFRENQPIDNPTEIEFLFPDYPENPDVVSTEIILRWGYENDKLEDFYSEHLESIIESGIVTPLIGCEIVMNSSFQSNTTFELYQFESKNFLYFKVIGDGTDSNCFDTDGFFRILERNSNLDVIELFKSECYEVFTLNGEFDSDELLSEGHSIEFNQ